MCIIFWLIILLLQVFGTVYAQNSDKFSDRLFVSAKTHYGFILPHNKSMAFSIDRNFPGWELALNISCRPASGYGRLYNYPRTGIGFFSAVMHQNDVFGEVYALYPFINIPINKKNYRSSINYQIGFGFSYLTKIWDKEKNLKNIAIGTHENIYFNFGLDGRTILIQRLEATGGIGITHFSNGNIKKPNLGINYISASAGLIYKINSAPVLYTHPSLLPPLPDWKYSAVLAGGVRTYMMAYEGLYPSYSVSFDAVKNFSHKRNLGAGADIFYNTSLGPYLDTLGLNRDQFTNLMQGGIHGTHGLMYNRLEMIIQLGVYVYARHKDKPLYSRFGIRYSIANRWLASLALKTHYATADVVEWGIGYSIASREKRTIEE